VPPKSDTDDGGSTHLCNVGLLRDYTALQNVVFEWLALFASYSGGSGFKFRSEYWLSLQVFRGFPQSLRATAGIVT
jgi:hypothetical protein